MPDEALIRRLMEQAMESGSSPEEVCPGDPELQEELRLRLRRLRAVDAEVEALFPSTHGRSPGPGVHGVRALTELPSVPGYTVESVLGSGGTGVVFKARHLKLNRRVAVKMLALGPYASANDLACIRREAESVAALQHPNIVQVHDVGEHEGLPYFTMEFVDGGTLAQELAGAPRRPREAAELTLLLARAARAAHERGIVHRDLKPGNILLTTTGIPKIADFSLARRFEGGDMTLSSAGVGTPSYMAPEQALGKPDAFGPPVDIYALGAILYELLTGRPPFRADSPAETQRQVVTEDPAPPSRLNAGVPRDLETICLKCLSKEPARRYPTAAALADDLGRYLAGKPVRARRSGAIERGAKWARRQPAAAGLLAAGVLGGGVMLGAGLWFASQRAALREAVHMDLEELGRHERAGDWTSAKRVLDLAKARLGDGGPADLQRRVTTGQADLDLIARLDGIRLRRMASLRPSDRERAWRDYTAAFSDSGYTTGSDTPAEFAARIASSPVRLALVEAIDGWTLCATDKGQIPRLLEVARLADPDPAWGDRVRDYRGWTDAAVLGELARGAPVEGPSVSLILLLASLLDDAGGDSVGLLRRVQRAHPDEFWTNVLLGELLDARGDIDAIGYYRTAHALRPRAVPALANLGVALSRHGHDEEAMICWSRAAEIDPGCALAHSNLASWAINKGKGDEAVAHARETVRLEPDWAPAHAVLGHALVMTRRFTEARAPLERAIALLKPGEPLYEGAVANLGRCTDAASTPPTSTLPNDGQEGGGRGP